MNAIDSLLRSLSTDAAVRDVRVGPFWTAVLLDTDPLRCGLASTVHRDDHTAGSGVSDPGHLAGRSGLALAALLRASSVLEASVGMAAYNALLSVDESACVEANARDLILERGAGRRVAIVGHFPFVPRVREVASACWVLELNPRPGDLPAERAPEVLPQADVVALTGTSLTNHTFDSLIALCRPDAFVVLLGGSAPLTPVLLDLGVSAVAGTLVIEPLAALEAVGQGATFRQIPGRRLLTMMQET